MRVKVQGEITADRLAEALQVALDRCESVRPACKFYGANLYLTPFDVDGMPFDLADHEGKSITITLPAKTGQLVKPAITADGEARRELRRQMAAAAIAAAVAQDEESERELERERNVFLEENRRRTEARRVWKAQFDAVNTLTKKLMSPNPAHLVRELNSIVCQVWDELKPVEATGERKGCPLPLPAYSAHLDRLWLNFAKWKNPRMIRNPFWQSCGEEPNPFWTHEAWRECTKRMIKRMNQMARED